MPLQNYTWMTNAVKTGMRFLGSSSKRIIDGGETIGGFLNPLKRKISDNESTEVSWRKRKNRRSGSDLQDSVVERPQKYTSKRVHRRSTAAAQESARQAEEQRMYASGNIPRQRPVAEEPVQSSEEPRQSSEEPQMQAYSEPYFQSQEAEEIFEPAVEPVETPVITPVIPVQQAATEKTVETPAVPQQKHPAQKPVKSPAIPRQKAPAAKPLFSRVTFGNDEERMRSEVYIKDFSSANPLKRGRAIEAIKQMSRPTATGILRQLLYETKHNFKIMQIVNALSALNYDCSMPKSQFEVYLGHSNFNVRLAAIRAIAKYKDEGCYEVLSSALDDKSADIRRQALNLLCWTYQERCENSVLKMLHDMDSRVRKTAIQICGVMRMYKSISAITRMINDLDSVLQKTAIETLRKITHKRFGYNADASIESKNEAIEAWRFWWLQNQATYGLQLKKESPYVH